ncbi:hypothetical protein [Desulfosporosinus hippei]|uniref:Uncharacterized protein n=1 Tax=Desulfosporosinus hippei DSM 8344 TaxID=1121419 RepID=A0A1G8GT85_9FIRM|nr:hypothetical protein [Desulfosporosinus hippei]SDH97490.1 hypothetical protein SAMN05443529_12348 [Desulfosporosinus hippei DSM 8344]
MKKNLGSVNTLYPMPVVIVGTKINGKANYITIAHVGIIDMKTFNILPFYPPKISKIRQLYRTLVNGKTPVIKHDWHLFIHNYHST